MKIKPPSPPHPRSSGSPMDGLTDSHLITVPTRKTNEEEDNSERVTNKSCLLFDISRIHVPKKRLKVNNGRSHPYYLSSCKRFESNINSLPVDIVFDILVQLPAQDIYSAVRTVCRKWYQIIHTNKFVHTHFHHSTYGLLVQKRVSQSTQLAFMALSRQGQIELTRLNYEPEHHILCSSCNGLILECERRNDNTLYISNPVTMQRFSLPPFAFPDPVMDLHYSALAYASLSMEYKVVRVYLNRENFQLGCIILTVGVDESWRPVCTQHLSLRSKQNLVFRPLTTEGFVHWVNMSNYVLTLNVETEIITEHPFPSSGDGICFFPTAKYLSLLIANSCRSCSWDIWEMKPETGEWTQLPGIDLKDQMFEILGSSSEFDTIYKLSPAYIGSWLVPVGWLEYKEVFLYRVTNGIFAAWNIRLNKFEFIKLDSDLDGFFVHRNSLLWLDGC
ncbi:hypothetical protein CASFOL_041105 [Castilleja foliolosa]|uniref:F-box domain-containing protein n=1 Tax=Castilleja foliolosa TaxID=1961234 RepID=A0ABD3BDV6_9LAMI